MSCGNAIRAALIASAMAMSSGARAEGASPDSNCAALSRDDGRGRWQAAWVPPGHVEREGPRQSARMPGFCRVQGTLHPVAGSNIGFELWLPAAGRWTGRLQMLGNGGYSSAMPRVQMAMALDRGSAVVATDTGHVGDGPDFAAGRPEAIIDWGWRAVHETAVAARRIVRQHFGRPPRHAYFNGCSTGGHQAMMEAQRFPHDFDGIVAGAPGSNRVRLNAAFLWQFRANNPQAGKGPMLDAQDLDLLARNALAQCRPANGGHAGGRAQDPWLNDPLSCRPDLSAIACAPGRTGQCLGPDKLAAAQAMYRGATDRAGRTLTFPWLAGSETGWSGYWADPADARAPARADFWRIWALGAQRWDPWSFRFDRDLALAQRRLSPVIDAVDPDLSAFRDRGGRLLVYHGLADPVVSPLDTLAYRRQVLDRLKETPEAASRWYRLFLAPGMQHCGGGTGPARFDAQAAMERWVEDGVAPAWIDAKTAAQETRPICPFPQIAVAGSGDAWACRAASE